MTSFRVPGATYRLQFNRNFKFAAARAVVAYLHDLGITDIYASPLFQATRGSLHGYSVTNPMQLNPELGSRRDFDALARGLKTRGMGLLFDIVPNHMALSPDNPWWMEVLENGPSSPYSQFFDIEWHPPRRILEGKVLLPILGRPYGQALEEQELRLTMEDAGFFVNYYEHKFPLDPKTYRHILAYRLEELAQKLGEDNPAIISLRGIITMIMHFPARTLVGPNKMKERARDKEIIKKNLWLLFQNSPEIKAFIQENLELFNGSKGDPRSFDLLDRLLGEQAYRLAFWQVALEMINYRRFFSINDLIGIRMEDPKVFEAYRHALLFKLVAEGKVSGLRIDHIDGLYDPLEYLERLVRNLPENPNVCGEGKSFYILVEKILAPGEAIPLEWPVCGTTGYDFLNMANGLFIAEPGLKELRSIYIRFVGAAPSFPEMVRTRKKLMMATFFGGEVENHGFYLGHLAFQDRQARDLHRKDLIRVLVEVTATLPVYRTYIRSFEVSARDRVYLERAIAEVRRLCPDISQPALDFLRRVLLLELPSYLTGEQKREWLEFVKRWQQFTGPIMAKGLEDTALYLYNPLVSQNEVGAIFKPVSIRAFHSFNRERQANSPLTMNASSTHDTKRSEDVRARLNVLSEMPKEWEACLHRWGDWNRAKKVMVRGRAAPDANEEIFLYQTLLGAWPLFPEEVPAFKERLRGYLVKAAREAMAHSRWVSPDVEYENALLQFLEDILGEGPENEFLPDFLEMQARLAFYGVLNSLSQTLLKITSPGVPDFYQGEELLNFSLVDPDNRRPVDFARREQLLKVIQRQEKKCRKTMLAEAWRHWRDGRLKLYVIYRALNFRKNHPDIFLTGDYLPLAAAGERRNNVIALARRREKDWLVAAAARFFSHLVKPGQAPLGPEAWGEGALLLPPAAPGRWLELFSGEVLEAVPSSRARSLSLARLFRSLPVALLTPEA